MAQSFRNLISIQKRCAIGICRQKRSPLTSFTSSVTIVPCRIRTTHLEKRNGTASWAKFSYAKTSLPPGDVSGHPPRYLGLAHFLSKPGKGHSLALESPRRRRIVRTEREHSWESDQPVQLDGLLYHERRSARGSTRVRRSHVQ